MVFLLVVIGLSVFYYFLYEKSEEGIKNKKTNKEQKLWIYIFIIILGIMCLGFYPAGGSFTNIVDAFERGYQDDAVPLTIGILVFCFIGYKLHMLSYQFKENNKTYDKAESNQKETLNKEQIEKKINDYNAYLQNKENNALGIVSLICGIISYLIFPILGVIAIVFGVVAIKNFDEYTQKNKWFRNSWNCFGCYCHYLTILLV